MSTNEFYYNGIDMFCDHVRMGNTVIFRDPEVPIYSTTDRDQDVLEVVYENYQGNVYVRTSPYGVELTLEKAFELAVRLQAFCVTQMDFNFTTTETV